MTKPKIVVNNDNPLTVLIANAMEAAKLARMAMQFESVEARRNAHIAYGQALLILRNEYANKNTFNDVLKQHDLIEGDSSYRSNCMDIARIVAESSDLATWLNQCPYSSPQHVRQWIREKTRPESKPESKPKIEPQLEPKATRERNAEPDLSKKPRWKKEESAKNEEGRKILTLENRIHFLEKALFEADAAYATVKQTIEALAPLTRDDFWPTMKSDLEEIKKSLRNLTPLFRGSQQKFDEANLWEFLGIKK